MKTNIGRTLLTLVFVLTITSQSAAFFAAPQKTDSNGGSDPWPWSAFPWKDLNGVWSGEINNVLHIYLFRAVPTIKNRDHILHILELSPYNCHIVSRGLGFLQNREIKAVLTGKFGQYELMIRAFNSWDIEANDLNSPALKLATIALSPNANRNIRHFTVLTKIDNDLGALCEQSR